MAGFGVSGLGFEDDRGQGTQLHPRCRRFVDSQFHTTPASEGSDRPPSSQGLDGFGQAVGSADGVVVKRFGDVLGDVAGSVSGIGAQLDVADVGVTGDFEPLGFENSLGEVLALDDAVQVWMPTSSARRWLDFTHRTTTNHPTIPESSAAEAGEGVVQLIESLLQSETGVLDRQGEEAVRSVAEVRRKVGSYSMSLESGAGSAEAVMAVTGDDGDVVGVGLIVDDPGIRAAVAESISSLGKPVDDFESVVNTSAVVQPT